MMTNRGIRSPRLEFKINEEAEEMYQTCIKCEVGKGRGSTFGLIGGSMGEVSNSWLQI
jgi:hypothetical protein